MSEENAALPSVVTAEIQQAKSLLEGLGVEPTAANINALVQFIQNNTTIHARESDPYLPDAENIAEWEKLRPGTADEVMEIISDVVKGNRADISETNRIRRENEKSGFNVARVTTLGCAPLALIASHFGIPTQLCIAIVIMGIGGPTAASFFGNWAGKTKD